MNVSTVELVRVNVQLALSAQATANTKSTLIPASIAEHAQVHAHPALSARNNPDFQKNFRYAKKSVCLGRHSFFVR